MTRIGDRIGAQIQWCSDISAIAGRVSGLRAALTMTPDQIRAAIEEEMAVMLRLKDNPPLDRGL